MSNLHRLDGLTFISITTPASLKDRSIQQHARTAAILHVKKATRQRASAQGDNFRSVKGKDTLAKTTKRNMARVIQASKTPAQRLPFALGASSIDPFESLPVNAARLTKLLYLPSSAAAGEPIFNLGQVTSHMSLKDVFGAGLCDAALASAFSLTLSLAANQWHFDRESLELESTAIQHLNNRLACADLSVESTTIGVVILLLGVEYRLNRQAAVECHLKGIQSLLDLHRSKGIILPDPLRRAIFWQDMLCSFVAGTSRVLDYTFYPSALISAEMNQSQKIVPHGFRACQDVLSEDILNLTAKVHALYKIRAGIFTSYPTPRVIEQVDTLQALLESETQELLVKTTDSVEVSCILAIFLCIYGFWDGVWNASLLPRVISRRLLAELQHSTTRFDWPRYDNLLTWLICIGSAFSVEEPTRQGFLYIRRHREYKLVHEIFHSDRQQSILHDFIWSDVFYNKEHGSFWQHINISPI